jgi:thiamine pyrophosphate-dependent acetolactate synthase large subunit-like protein
MRPVWLTLADPGRIVQWSIRSRPRYREDVRVIQLDIAPEEIGHNKATEVALIGDGKAIVEQLNKALADPPVVPPEWTRRVRRDDHQEGGGERGDDPAADPRRRAAGRPRGLRMFHSLNDLEALHIGLIISGS